MWEGCREECCSEIHQNRRSTGQRKSVWDRDPHGGLRTIIKSHLTLEQLTSGFFVFKVGHIDPRNPASTKLWYHQVESTQLAMAPPLPNEEGTTKF